MAETTGTTIRIATDADIVTARQKGRAMAAQMGFSPSQATFVATAISELARNIVTYAGHGEITLRAALNGHAPAGIEVVARDAGPGIHNVADALRDGYSTSGSLGLGLPGIRRLMDEFEIASEVGRGTTVRVTKWLR